MAQTSGTREISLDIMKSPQDVHKQGSAEIFEKWKDPSPWWCGLREYQLMEPVSGLSLPAALSLTMRVWSQILSWCSGDMMGLWTCVLVQCPAVSQSRTQQCLGSSGAAAQHWCSSKQGNNLAHRLDNAVQTQRWCQESCCLEELRACFSSDTVSWCRELWWGLRKGDLTVVPVMLHFASNFRSRAGIREEAQSYSRICLVLQERFPLSLHSSQ